MTLMVIETEDDQFLGTMEIEDGRIRVRTHTAGHPVFVDVEDILSVTPASDHPAVEE